MRATGNRFEAQALKQLETAGLTLIARNYSTRYGELDLVMRQKQTVVFVEVRYRQSRGFGSAAASVGARKQAKLIRAAQGFLAAHPQYRQAPCRFDVLAFDGREGDIECHWQQGAFDAF